MHHPGAYLGNWGALPPPPWRWKFLSVLSFNVKTCLCQNLNTSENVHLECTPGHSPFQIYKYAAGITTWFAWCWKKIHKMLYETPKNSLLLVIRIKSFPSLPSKLALGHQLVQLCTRLEQRLFGTHFRKSWNQTTHVHYRYNYDFQSLFAQTSFQSGSS